MFRDKLIYHPVLLAACYLTYFPACSLNSAKINIFEVVGVGVRSFRPMVLSPEDVSPDLRVDLPKEKVEVYPK